MHACIPSYVSKTKKTRLLYFSRIPFDLHWLPRKEVGEKKCDVLQSCKNRYWYGAEKRESPYFRTETWFSSCAARASSLFLHLTLVDEIVCMSRYMLRRRATYGSRGDATLSFSRFSLSVGRLNLYDLIFLCFLSLRPLHTLDSITPSNRVFNEQCSATISLDRVSPYQGSQPMVQDYR